MADKKVTQLTQVTTLPDTAKIYAVDLTRAVDDQDVQIDKSDLVSGAVEGDRATITNVIPITNIAGSNYNFNTANPETAYTVTRNSIINQFAQVFINTLTKPTLTLGGVTFTEVGGIGWTASTDLYLYLRDLGVDGIHYAFLPKAVGSSGGGAVDSVNTQTGVVVLDTDDIADTAINRYTNDTDITRLANTSGTNTGDQDLSAYLIDPTTTAGDIIWRNALGNIDRIGVGAENDLLGISGGDVKWVNPPVNQTLSNTSDVSSHTTTLSASGGSLKLIEGTGITLTTAGTALDGTVTIDSTGGGTISGSITDNQVAIGATTADSIEGSADMTYDSTTKTLTLGTDGTAEDKAIIQAGTFSVSLNDGDGEFVAQGDFRGGGFSTFGGTGTDVLLDNGATKPILDFTSETAIYSATSTAITTLDCDTFDSRYQILTANTDIQWTNTPASGESFVKNLEVVSTATESLAFSTATKIIGSFVSDGTTVNLITVNFANYPTLGLRITVLITQ